MVEFKDLPPLEQVCIVCDGKGTQEYEYTTGKKVKKVKKAKTTCQACYGRCKQLSEFGKAVLELVSRYQPWQQDLEATAQSLRDDIDRRNNPYGGTYY